MENQDQLDPRECLEHQAAREDREAPDCLELSAMTVRQDNLGRTAQLDSQEKWEPQGQRVHVARSVTSECLETREPEERLEEQEKQGVQEAMERRVQRDSQEEPETTD